MTKNVLVGMFSSKSGRDLYEQKNQNKNMKQLMVQILEDNDEWKGI